MDPFAAIVMLIIAFTAYVQNILWLFIGIIIILLIITRSLSLAAVAIGGIAALELLELQEYWFIVLGILAGLILLKEHRKKKSEEFYSPEMMSLLDEY